MFTGITTDVGEVVEMRQQAEGLRRLIIACTYDRASIALGASIACSGVCLTVVDTGSRGNRTTFSVDAAAETLRMTTAGSWQAGARLNLERALKVGDELGGHIVAGHADGTAELIAREDLTDMARLTFRTPKPLMRFVASKGSVALDGVSLTVNEVTAETFAVLIIPHTLAVTTLGAAKPGTQVNIEIDLMARYAARLLETRENLS
jgi:riboflavin synthase